MLPDIVRRVDRRQPAFRFAFPRTAFLPRKNSAGLFDERKSDDDKEENHRNTCVFQGSMTLSALIYTIEKRVRPCQAKVTKLKKKNGGKHDETVFSNSTLSRNGLRTGRLQQRHPE